MSSDLAPFVAIFLEEAEEAASAWEKACLDLESDTSDATVNQLFRTAHNLKGSSKSIGLSHFGDFIHEVENLITKVKNKSVAVEPSLTSILLEAESWIRSWIEALRANPEAMVDSESFLQRVRTYQNGGGSAQQSSAPVQKEESKQTNLIDTLINAKGGDVVFNDELMPKKDKPAEVAAAPVVAPPSQTTGAPAKAPAASAPAPAAQESIRINLQRLDSLINLVGELVIEQNILAKRLSQTVDPSSDIAASSSRITKTVTEIQNLAMSFRMIPVSAQFQKMTRTVRDLAQKQGKNINFQTIGEEVELDKTLVDNLGDPLTHLIRNAVDHGIETPEERVAAGKAPSAKVDLIAYQRDDHVEVIVRDDGKGIDTSRVFNKAVEKGLISANKKLTEKEMFNLILLPGFSTREQVTDVSGRGVGMDVVNSLVTEMKGTLDISSKLGKGTTFTIKLPLSLSIIRGLVARIGTETFVLPTSQLVEVIDMEKLRIESHTGKARMLNLRGEVLPVYRLQELIWRKRNGNTQTDVSGVVVNCKSRKVALQFDEIIDEQSVVLKKLSAKIQDLPGVLGGAVLSNGEPALVLSLPDIVEMWGSNAA